MTSYRDWEFKKQFFALPKSVQELALRGFKHWLLDTKHISLQFKRIDDEDDIWSVRIGDHYRAMCKRKPGNVYVWFWIGTHEEYNGLI